MICSHCQGAKTVQGIACGPGSARVGAFPCSTCLGTGEIGDERAAWMAVGERLRAWRMDGLDLSLREAARRFNLVPSVWSDAEQGRIDPAPLIANVSRQLGHDMVDR